MTSPKRDPRLSGLLLTGLLVLLAVAACGSTGDPVSGDEQATAVVVATNTPTAVPPTDTAVAATDTPVAPEGTAAPPSNTEAPATATPLPPTSTPQPTEVPPIAAAFGQTEDGLYFRGNPDAEITLIDYSDFL